MQYLQVLLNYATFYNNYVYPKVYSELKKTIIAPLFSPSFFFSLRDSAATLRRFCCIKLTSAGHLWTVQSDVSLIKSTYMVMEGWPIVIFRAFTFTVLFLGNNFSSH